MKNEFKFSYAAKVHNAQINLPHKGTKISSSYIVKKSKSCNKLHFPVMENLAS